MIRAVFLDREGVITPKLGPGEYVLEPSQAVLADGVVSALEALRSAGVKLFIVSNQSCVGRRMISAQMCDMLHAKIVDELSRRGITIDESRLCVHTEEDDCRCRKPRPGMVLELCERHGIDPTHSVLIGDSVTDALAGAAAGCATQYLITSLEQTDVPERTETVASLAHAIERILHTHV